MPTGNEFQDVRFGQQDQSYKQTDRDMSPGWDANVTSEGQQPTSGQYPNVYDRQAGSEPLGTSSEDNPFYYPQRVFDEIQCTGPGQSYVMTERESIGGEFNACHPGLELGKFTSADNIVPDTVPSKQFSSDKNGDPRALLQATRSEISQHAEINQLYGLNQPAATLGSHPWLRDELATPSETEPANAVPAKGMKVPA
jgi:hypothetical protein